MCDVSSEAKFSRAFTEFAEAKLLARPHAMLIEAGYAEQWVGHTSRDAAAIVVREKPARSKRKREERLKAPCRLVRQRTMHLEEMLTELP